MAHNLAEGPETDWQLLHLSKLVGSTMSKSERWTSCFGWIMAGAAEGACTKWLFQPTRPTIKPAAVTTVASFANKALLACRHITEDQDLRRAEIAGKGCQSGRLK